MKLRLPGLAGTYSLNFLFVLIGIAYLGLPGTRVAGCAAVVAQSVWNTQRRPTLVQVLFNMANLAISIGLCLLVAHGLLSAGLRPDQPAAAALIAASWSACCRLRGNPAHPIPGWSCYRCLTSATSSTA